MQAAVWAAEQGAVLKLAAELLIITNFIQRSAGGGRAGGGSFGIAFPVEKGGGRHEAVRVLVCPEGAFVQCEPQFVQAAHPRKNPQVR